MGEGLKIERSDAGAGDCLSAFFSVVVSCSIVGGPGGMSVRERLWESDPPEPLPCAVMSRAFSCMYPRAQGSVESTRVIQKSLFSLLRPSFLPPSLPSTQILPGAEK